MPKSQEAINPENTQVEPGPIDLKTGMARQSFYCVQHKCNIVCGGGISLFPAHKLISLFPLLCFLLFCPSIQLLLSHIEANFKYI